MGAGDKGAGPEGVTVRIYAITQCLHVATASNTETRCLVDGDKIPTTAFQYLGSAPASVGAFSFVVYRPEGVAIGYLDDVGPAVYAVVLQAVNAKGGSGFAIAGTSVSCWGCTL